MGGEFEAAKRVGDLLSGFNRPWFIAGGWAVDLYLGRETRAHADVEIAVWRGDQRDLQRYFRGWSFAKAVPGAGERAPWPPGEWLALPFHEIRARSQDDLELEILLQEQSGGEWRYRRNLVVSCPADKVGVGSATGLPILAPAIVLLCKAKQPRPKDEDDFRLLRPELPPASAAWLREAIAICHPGHPWLQAL